jgi:membrane protein implicated in regulation of membrane protease activity
MMSYWQWWVLAGVLLIVEVLAPGTFFLWLAVSAAAVGLLVWLLPATSVEAAWALFAVLGVVSVVMVLKFRKRPREDAATKLNKRGQEYIGRTFELTEAIHNGKGKLKIGDTLWTVYGPDLAAGTRVEVVAVDRGDLRVEAT